MAIEITRESALAGLKAIVDAEGEDFVYPANRATALGGGCKYVFEGKPDCLIGRYLHSIGVPLERLEEADKANGNSGIGAGSLLRDLGAEGVVQSEWTTRDMLGDVQHRQDHGYTWGHALEVAGS